MTDTSIFPNGTVALRVTDTGTDLYLRSSGRHGEPGWVAAGGPFGHEVIPLDTLVEQFSEMTDFESYRLHIVDDPSAPTLHLDGSDEWEDLPDNFGEFDGRVNTRNAIRVATIRAALAEQPLGTIVYFDSDEDTADRNAAVRIGDGWLSTTNACAFIADTDGRGVDPTGLTVIHVPDGSAA